MCRNSGGISWHSDSLSTRLECVVQMDRQTKRFRDTEVSVTLVIFTEAATYVTTGRQQNSTDNQNDCIRLQEQQKTSNDTKSWSYQLGSLSHLQRQQYLSSGL